MLFIPSSTIILDPDVGKHTKEPFLYQPRAGCPHTPHETSVSVS